MKLAFRQIGTGRPLIVLHGLFGSSDNWQTLGKKFAESHEVYLIDQRNHGKSPHSDEFNYDILADDLSEFMDQQGLSSAVLLGHSMGGKTVMRFAQKYSEKVDKLIVADMGIKSYPPHHQDVLKAFHAIQPETLTSRSEAEERIAPIISDFGVRQFLLKNLYRSKDTGYGIRANYLVLERKMDRILEPLPDGLVETESLFIRGARSDYVPTEDYDSIREVFSNVDFVEIEAGHWLHAEKPTEFYDAVKKFVTS